MVKLKGCGPASPVPKSLIIRGCLLRIICFTGTAIEYKFERFCPRLHTHLLLCCSQSAVHPQNEGETEMFYLDRGYAVQPTCMSSCVFCRMVFVFQTARHDILTCSIENHCLLSHLCSSVEWMPRLFKHNSNLLLQIIPHLPSAIVDLFGLLRRDQLHLVHTLYVHMVRRCVFVFCCTFWQ